MIDKSEILEQAQKTKLDPSMIEKDYVLGWILFGIQQNEEVQQYWIFKGGTCLKKCYFDEYRYSEDLDFTLKASKMGTAKTLRSLLSTICSWVYENSGIEILDHSIALEEYQNLQGNLSFQGKLTYQGPLRRKTNFPKIKLDFTSQESIVNPPVIRPIFHNYSDHPNTKEKLNCYSYEELFAEKIRALEERARPRDLYDVIHLYQERSLIQDKSKLISTLKSKCDFKKIPFPTLELIQRHPHHSILLSEWDNMLSRQVPNLKPFEFFWSKLPEIFDWLNQA